MSKAAVQIIGWSVCLFFFFFFMSLFVACVHLSPSLADAQAYNVIPKSLHVSVNISHLEACLSSAGQFTTTSHGVRG